MTSQARQLADKSVAPPGRRNLIMNGAMQVAQRGTSKASLSSTADIHTVDRWRFHANSSGTFTVSQSTESPNGFSNSYKVECTAEDSSPDYVNFSQRMEGQNLQHLKKGTSDAVPVVVSFYVRSSKTGTYQVSLLDEDNSRMVGKTYTIDTANTWEYKTLTFPADTSGALDNDNGNSFQIEWWLAAGSTFSGGSVPTTWEAKDNTDRAAGLTVDIGASTSDDWYITGVQLEIGRTATEFEHRSYGEELRLCQRYFECSYNEGPPSDWSGDHYYEGVYIGNPGTSSGVYITGVPFKVTKRTTNPVVTCYSKTGTSGLITEGSTDRTIHSIADNEDHIVRVRTTDATSGGVFFIYDADAEL